MYKDRIEELADKLPKLKESYYNDTPLVTDEVFDALEDDLRGLDPENDYFKLVGAPVVGDGKRKHSIAMGSQAKIKIDDDGVDGIEEVIKKFIGKRHCIVSYKMDGISFAVDYVNGQYQHATTRGDGFIGEDIPDATVFFNVPEEIDEEYTMTARGELFMTYKDFETVNSQLDDDDKFSNPRNAVAGITRKKDSPFRRHIKAYYYDAVGDAVKDCTTKTDILGTLVGAFGFAVVWYDLNITPVSFRELAEDLNKTRKELPYMIDGLVIEFDDLEYAKSLGVANGNKPKGSVALKFDAVAETTTVTDVVWQVSSTGDLTPVVEFEPTLIDGSIVRRASIHNYDIFKKWGFAVGDDIRVQKNNDIIPQVKDVVGRHEGSIVCEAPTQCPVCGIELELIKVSKTTNLVCTNPVCDAKRVGAIKKWCTKAGMTSKGIGDAFFKSYVDYCESQDDGFNISTVYCLSIDDIMEMSDRYKTKSATKIYSAIQSSKTMKLMDFFGGLNIHGAGSRTFKKIIDAKKVSTIGNMLLCVSSTSIEKIDGIGPITAKVIRDGLADYRPRIDALSKLIEIEAEDAINEDAQTFVFTGTFVTIDPETGKGYKRKALEALVSSKGHKPASTVNKSLDYLVTSDPDSTKGKMKKARDLGVAIIGEEEFFGMMV